MDECEVSTTVETNTSVTPVQISLNGLDQKIHVVVDSNIWIHELDWITRLLMDENYDRSVIFVPQKVADELNGLQFNDDEETREQAREALRQMKDALNLWNENRIIIQSDDDAKEVKNEFPEKDQGDPQIMASARLLQRRGIRTQLFTRDKYMEILCFAAPRIEIFKPLTKEWDLKLENRKCLIENFITIYLRMHSIILMVFFLAGNRLRELKRRNSDVELWNRSMQISRNYLMSEPPKRKRIEEAAEINDQTK